METTFMTIHNLTHEANILFASESIVDILGYSPYEVISRSCFDYFHPDDVPFARFGHRQSLKLDKAAVLYYARIRARNFEWIACECVFTIVHDVLVACTSIYKGDLKSSQRDIEVKKINRLFSSPPRDPRYHMLEHLKYKFTASPQPHTGEPRAALILNRFSRTLSIMYATNAVASILGVTPDEIHGKSFYECIQENCLPEAIRCLEGAKANDSIAYLRFIYRDPRRQEDLEEPEVEASQSSDSEDGGVQLDEYQAEAGDIEMDGVEHHFSSADQSGSFLWSAHSNLRTDSGGSADERESANTMFDVHHPTQSHSSASSAPPLVGDRQGSNDHWVRRSSSRSIEPFEVEAVISCTSDGLVVILRAVPMPQPRTPEFANGIFAAPWATEPIMPRYQHSPVVRSGGPSMDDFMSSIRDVAVFAWSLTGINGNIASYSHGTPRGEAVPPAGFPIWVPEGQHNHDPGPENQAVKKWAGLGRTNSPPNGRQVPYQHPREEELIRTRKLHSSGSVDTSARQAYGLRDNAFINWQCSPHSQYGFGLPVPTMVQGYPNILSTNSNGAQEQGSSGSTHPIRYMWY